MKIYYIANARMPTDKAHGIQIAKMCEAFVEAGVDLTLVVSSRGSGNMKEAYGLTREVSLLRLPVLDLQFLGPVGYRFTASLFAIEPLLFLWMKVLRGEQFRIYTIDMDSFSFALLALVPRPLYAEMHSIKKMGFLKRYFFKRAHVIATNTLIGGELAHTFNIPPARLCIEPNGVDESVLQNTVSREDARRQLNVSNEPFALYVGRIYAWKGLEILADAAEHSPVPILVVGGTQEEYEEVTKKSGKELRFVGVQPHSEIPLWLAAADIVLVLGTAQNEDSYRYTAPMKIFEYLAAGRPTVASKTLAVASIMPEETAFWYEPDNAHALALAIQEAYAGSSPGKVVAGRACATEHTWRRRTERILAFIQSVTP